MPVNSTIRSSADWSSGSPPFSVTVSAIISLPNRLPEPISVLSSHSGTDIRSSRAVPAAVVISCAAFRNDGKADVVPVGVRLGVGVHAAVDEEHLVAGQQVATVDHDLLQAETRRQAADRGLVAVQERTSVLGDERPGEVVSERPAATAGAVWVSLVHRREHGVAGTLSPEHVRATKAGEAGSDDRDPRMGLQLCDSERERRRRASGQRGARRQPAGADEDLAPSAPIRLAGASQHLVDGNAGRAQPARAPRTSGARGSFPANAPPGRVEHPSQAWRVG